MTRTADIVIIGGGVMGASIAYHLAARRAGRVILVEKGWLASGPTGKSSAIIRQHYSNAVTAAMALHSFQVFRDFSDIIGGSAGFVQTGFLILTAAKDRDGLAANVALQQRVGIRTSLVSADDLKDLAPHLDVRDLVAAAYEPDSGYADPVKTTTALAARAQALGAEVHEGVAVTGLLVTGDRVNGVKTAQGDIDAPVVVNAAGPWAARLARQAGIVLPIDVSRHQVASMRRPHDAGAPHPGYADFINMIYARPDAGEFTIAGGIDPAEQEPVVDPDRYDEGADQPFIERMSARLRARMPGFARAISRGGWSGLYDITPDWHPILDRLMDGFYCAAGFSGHGFKLAPAVGAMMADLITGTAQSGLDIALFRARRFQEHAPIKGQYEYSIIG